MPTASAADSSQLTPSPVTTPILTPDQIELEQLCEWLASHAHRWRSPADWPAEALAACAQAGVFRWFLSSSHGGAGWDEVDQTKGFLRLAAADLTTTFIITQFIGACRRIAGSDNPVPRSKWLEPLLSGQAFATVGISHLTTSRRHLATPVLAAEPDPQTGGFRLTGMSPWVTGGAHADVIVLAATTVDGRQLLAAVPTSTPGISCHRGAEFVALSASCTDKVMLQDVAVAPDWILAGPIEDVMRSGTGAGTGGLQTSTLAIGLSRAAVNYVAQEAIKRTDLQPIVEPLVAQVDELEARLLAAAAGDACDPGELRGDANRLVMRTTQAAMTTAKGAGFVDGHPVGRWCREALFFLVWSCPQPIAAAQLCELAGIES